MLQFFIFALKMFGKPTQGAVAVSRWLKIKSCKECLYFTRGERQSYCWNNNGCRVIPRPSRIPRFCPLPTTQKLKEQLP